jgi:NitT/TauT family transport system substrate-binding protein
MRCRSAGIAIAKRQAFHLGAATALFALSAFALSAAVAAHAEPVKIGLLRVSASAPVYLAEERGYFAAEGLVARLVFADSAQLIALGVLAGDIDVGVTELSAGFYSAARNGTLRLVAGQSHEVPGFHALALIAANRAYEDGLRAAKSLSGFSVAIPGIGAPAHYALGRIAEKYRFDLSSVRLLSLSSVPYMISALAGGQADATVVPARAAAPLIERGDAAIIAWMGEEVPWQFGAVYAPARTADDRPEFLRRFLRAYRRAAEDYHNAVTAKDGTRRNGVDAAELFALIAKYDHLPADQAAPGLPYIDAEARLDGTDIQHQLDWYRAQHLVKGEAGIEQLIDRRYARLLPEE